VLFESQNACDRWIWIVSLSLVIAAFSLTVIIMLLYLNVEKFKSFIAGHKGDTIESIVDKVHLLFV